jgi:X-Pro dipeptidyl-peptidase
VACALLFAVPTGASAQSPAPSIAVENGVTQPVFGYADAIRERVWVDCAACDGDHDGVADRIALDIIRPQASAHGLKVPVIIDASPYYTTVGRGNEAELIADLDGDGINDKWPLFYDNYFVPRGYAMVLLDVDGTGNSTGCTDEGGRNDILSAKAGIDWLNGRATAHDAQGNEVVADWDNGRAAMIGKSYDGTIANGVAATGVEGLTTIVPVSAISSWYDYRRMGGITFLNNYPASLSNTVTNPDRRAYCAPSRDLLSANDGDETGDYTPFWVERDYNPDVGNVRASVFASHGINDDNVRPNHLSRWWAGLAARGVPRKLWLTNAGHVDPFDYRRAQWVDTLHRWFDFWLYGIPNGIMDEPMVDIERSPDVWETHSDWPLPGTSDTSVWLGPNGTLAPEKPKGQLRRQTFQDNPGQSEATMTANPTVAQPPRLPVRAARPRRAHLRHAGGAPARLCRSGADEPRRDPRRLRGRDAPDALGRRRAHVDDVHVLGREQRRRRPLLLRGDQAVGQRHELERRQGHPRQLEPRLARHRAAACPRRGIRLRHHGPADRLRLPGRPPDRRDRRRQLPPVPQHRQPEPREHRRRREAQHRHAADRRRKRDRDPERSVEPAGRARVEGGA